jgi:ketosteroid isomerase-like protein
LAVTTNEKEEAQKVSREATQEPITGREELGDVSKPTQALAQFYRALNARDLDLMSRNWDQGDEAAMDNPVGGIKRGWPEIRAVYERVFQGQAKFSFEFYDYTLHEVGNVFYAVGRERGTYEVGETKLDLAIRTTRVFRKIDGRWQQVHHHGSIDDPESLKAYQKAVLGR